jgi:pimeloyl-ACP methyl ester carboxylesterase
MTAEPTPIRHETFALPSRDGYPLRGDVRFAATASPGTPAVIVCHGFKGFKDWGFFPELALEIARAGLIAVSFNFSGSGIGPDLLTFTDPGRFERATLSGDLADLARVIDAETSGGLPGPPPGGLGLLGHSRGGAVALLAAAADPRVRCLCTWAAVAHFDRWDQATRAAWRERGTLDVVNARTGQVFRVTTDVLDDIEAHRHGRLDVTRAARELAIPHLIVHGDADESVPVAEGRLLASWGRGELLVLPGAGHTFGATHPLSSRPVHLDQALAATLAFFRRHLPPAR